MKNVWNSVFWIAFMVACILLNVWTISNGQGLAQTIATIGIVLCSITIAGHLYIIATALHGHFIPTSRVVINRCYGGFGISDKALAWLKEHGSQKTLEIIREAEEDNICQDDEEERRIAISCHVSDRIERHNPDLVMCVKEIGEDANTEYSSLSVVEFKGRKYIIDEYDGLETLVLPGLVEWTQIPIGLGKQHRKTKDK